jgi:phosphatidylserine/phosphatidylglycerophosphate/cardiolipin synthase-like enzyme
MQKLLDAITDVVFLVSPEKVRAIANRVRETDTGKAAGSLSGVVSTPAAAGVVDRLVDAWRATTVSADELASMLLVAGHVFTKTTNQQSTELVWTGPTTPFVSARRTEQVLLQIIKAAEKALFITSFVAYDVSAIVKALNDASARGVIISMLLESAQEHGGRISFDVIGKMRNWVPSVKLYSWRERTAPFADGRVHAKVVVADGDICFITSANLTGHAMEQNMEAGLLIRGGEIPKLLTEHLRALIDTGVVSRLD